MDSATQLLKRMEIVKSLLAIGDYEAAADLMEQSRDLDGADVLGIVWEHLAGTRWSDAHRELIAWLSSQTRLTGWQHPEVKALKAELIHLQNAIADAETEKATTAQRLHVFEIAYRQRLGDLITQLLRLRREKLKKQAEADSAYWEASKQADDEAKSFEQRYNHARKQTRIELTKDESAEIKSLYRKASKLCHPDMVRHELKNAAQNMFHRLIDAYEQQDVTTLRLLLAQFESGDFGDEQAIERADQPPEHLFELVERLRQKLAAIRTEIAALKAQANYKIAADESTWDAFFATQRQRLEDEIARFK